MSFASLPEDVWSALSAVDLTHLALADPMMMASCERVAAQHVRYTLQNCSWLANPWLQELSSGTTIPITHHTTLRRAFHAWFQLEKAVHFFMTAVGTYHHRRYPDRKFCLRPDGSFVYWGRCDGSADGPPLNFAGRMWIAGTAAKGHPATGDGNDPFYYKILKRFELPLVDGVALSKTDATEWPSTTYDRRVIYRSSAQFVFIEEEIGSVNAELESFGLAAVRSCNPAGELGLFENTFLDCDDGFEVASFLQEEPCDCDGHCRCIQGPVEELPLEQTFSMEALFFGIYGDCARCGGPLRSYRKVCLGCKKVSCQQVRPVWIHITSVSDMQQTS